MRLRSRLRSRRPFHLGRRESSWEYLQCAALDGTAALEQLGQVHADRLEAGLTQLCDETCGSRGKYNIQPVGNGVETKHVRVRAPDHDRIGKQRMQLVYGRRAE